MIDHDPGGALTTPNGSHPPDRSLGDGALVLDEIAIFLGRFVAFPSPAAQTAAALWAAHTHMVQQFESTPRLAVLSPEPGSGKSRLLEVLELLVPAPVYVLSARPAAVFRLIDQARPTLLFDEVDTIFGRTGSGDDASEDLRGLLNAGHRRSATIPRCVGPTHAVQHFPVYAAVALAGLGDLPGTLMSRSVVIRMRRRAPHERVESFRRRLVEPPGNKLRELLAAWAAEVGDACGNAWPDLPEGITDRAADVWEPLLAVADAAGGRWPELAREACVALNKVRADATPSVGVRLLGDVRNVFGDHDRMFSATIAEGLNAIEDAGWSSWGRGDGIRPADVARILSGYGIESKNVRIGAAQRKGYERRQLVDAFARYLGRPAAGGTPAAPSHGSDSPDHPVPDVERDGGTGGTALPGMAPGDG
jgi:hypothetical protein